MSSPSFTYLFEQGRRGDTAARNLAYNLVLAQLRRTAKRLLDREGHCVTLQPTALVSELFLRLHRLECRILNRDHFLALAARSMRHLLIDRGRGKAARRRLAPDVRGAFAATTEPESAAQMAVRHAWQRLRKLDPSAADALWLLKAEGLTINEVATRQKRPAWRVVADSDFALDWLEKFLAPRPAPPPTPEP